MRRPDHLMVWQQNLFVGVKAWLEAVGSVQGKGIQVSWPRHPQIVGRDCIDTVAGRKPTAANSRTARDSVKGADGQPGARKAFKELASRLSLALQRSNRSLIECRRKSCAFLCAYVQFWPLSY